VKFTHPQDFLDPTKPVFCRENSQKSQNIQQLCAFCAFWRLFRPWRLTGKSSL